MSLTRGTATTAPQSTRPGVGDLVVSAAGTVRDLLDHCVADDPIRAQLQQVHLTMQRLAALTTEPHHTARHRLPATAVDINTVVRQLEPSLQRLLGPFISLNTSLHVPGAWVAADRSQLEQVLLALVINAREALPLGGVICAGTRMLTLGSARRFRVGELSPGGWVLLEVRDNGGVVDDLALRQMLEPSTARRRFDSSLSLATMSQIVRDLRGHVVFDTAADRGTMLAAALPAVAPARHARGGDADAIAILVADDDAWNRLSMVRLLRRAGWGVLEAEHATAALELLDDVAGSCVRLLVVRAGLRGPDGALLSDQVRTMRPDLAVLAMSDPIHGAGPLDRPAASDALIQLVRQYIPLPG